MSDSPADRLRKARIAKGYGNAAEAARAFGWSIPTYTSHENGTRGIRPDAAERYARAFGTFSAAELIGIRTNKVETAEQIRVIASAAIGVWRDVTLDLNHDVAGQLSVALPSGVGMRSQNKFAVEVCDNSVNKSIADGEYAICVPMAMSDLTNCPPNSLLYIERSKGGLVERSIRRLVRTKDMQFALVTHSFDTRLTDQVSIDLAAIDASVVIKGRVVGKYAPLDLVEG